MVAIQDQDLVQQAENVRDNLDLVKALRANPDMVEYGAYSHATQSQLQHSLTATALSGPGMFIVKPVLFYNKTYTELTSVMHLGENICGHDGIIHGGLAATILDEALACVAIPALPNKFGFTANLNVNYRRPIMSDQWVMLKAKLDQLQDRKAFVSASIHSLDGETVFTEATSLYVSPKPKDSPQ
ncbi:HotDog domain-containing protein [Mucor mucedo]|uniref:HotDog domain-containing protein n=1 Tax=Mucor mucedo TaxID=29922 RepID=UPI00221EDECA|nr:HotDog domain-containing protein [Mucor mucedo]KAI7874341.1 HotDog domain-containing protein [Mucor mucedo]